MSLLFHWRGENYRADAKHGFAFHLNQNSPAMLKAKPRDRIWAFTRREDGLYVLAVSGAVEKVLHNAPGFRYGAYRVRLDPENTQYFDVERGLDVEPVIRSLSIKAGSKVLGRSFQGHRGVREISESDDQKLRDFAEKLQSYAV